MKLPLISGLLVSIAVVVVSALPYADSEVRDPFLMNQFQTIIHM